MHYNESVTAASVVFSLQMPKILLIDDDPDHCQLVSEYLRREKYMVELAYSGREAMDLLAVSDYDVIVMDWGLPDIAGVDLCRWYRSQGSAPVLMLTGRTEVSDRTEGLDAGADDYLLKPFAMKELMARIRALLRRPATFTPTALMCGPYKLNPAAFMVIRVDEEIRLPPREFALLHFLARHPDEVFSADALMCRVWPSHTEASKDTVRTAVKNIRRALNDAQIIETVTGSGYQLGSSARRNKSICP